LSSDYKLLPLVLMYLRSGENQVGGAVWAFLFEADRIGANLRLDASLLRHSNRVETGLVDWNAGQCQIIVAEDSSA
jgi:hypothetical protein